MFLHVGHGEGPQPDRCECGAIRPEAATSSCVAAGGKRLIGMARAGPARPPGGAATAATVPLRPRSPAARQVGCPRRCDAVPEQRRRPVTGQPVDRGGRFEQGIEPARRRHAIHHSQDAVRLHRFARQQQQRSAASAGRAPGPAGSATPRTARRCRARRGCAKPGGSAAKSRILQSGCGRCDFQKRQGGSSRDRGSRSIVTRRSRPGIGPRRDRSRWPGNRSSGGEPVHRPAAEPVATFQAAPPGRRMRRQHHVQRDDGTSLDMREHEVQPVQRSGQAARVSDRRSGISHN